MNSFPRAHIADIAESGAQRGDVARLERLLRGVTPTMDVEDGNAVVDAAVGILDGAGQGPSRLLPASALALFTTGAASVRPKALRERMLTSLARDTGLSRTLLDVVASYQGQLEQGNPIRLTVGELVHLITHAPPFPSPSANAREADNLPTRSPEGLTPAGWFLFDHVVRPMITRSLDSEIGQWLLVRQLWQHPKVRVALVVYAAPLLFAADAPAWGDVGMVAEAADAWLDALEYLPPTSGFQRVLARWLQRVAAVAPLDPWVRLLQSLPGWNEAEGNMMWDLVRQRRLAYPDEVWPPDVWTPWLQHPNAAIRTEAVTLLAWPSVAATAASVAPRTSSIAR